MRTMVAIPCLEQLPVLFVTSLDSLKAAGEAVKYYQPGSLVYDSRNKLALEAIEEGFDRVLWLDSDMVFEEDLMVRLAQTMDETDADMVTALCFTRKVPNIKPTIYDHIGYTYDIEEGKVIPEARNYWDYPRDSVFQVQACGMAACLMKVSAIRTVMEKKGLPFSPEIGFGEDLSFCKKAGEAGLRIMCDSRVKVGHIGTIVIGERNYEGKRDGTEGQR